MALLTTLLLSFLVVLAAMVAMAIGSLTGHGRIRGSCGGVADGPCRLCGRDGATTDAPESGE